MSKAWITCALVAAFTAGAQAAPVLDRSSYSVFMEGEGSPEQSNFQVSFDGRKEWFSRSGHDISVEESATSLGAGLWQVDVRVWSSVPLFPLAGEAGVIGLGVLGNGFDLDGDYRLQEFVLAYTDPNGDRFSSLNLADVFRSAFAEPWNGVTPPFLMAPLGGRYNQADLRFVLQDIHSVPEPGGFALAAVALLALTQARRSLQRKG